MARAQKLQDAMASNEARSSGYQNCAHHGLIFSRNSIFSRNNSIEHSFDSMRGMASSLISPRERGGEAARPSLDCEKCYGLGDRFIRDD